MDREWTGIHDWQWRPLENLIFRKKKPFLRRLRKGGRPRVDDRKSFEAVLWSARTGLPWSRLPERFGRRRTVARRLASWRRSCTLDRLWSRYLQFMGPTEREDWRRRLAQTGDHSRAFWRLEFQVALDLEWPVEKRYT